MVRCQVFLPDLRTARDEELLRALDAFRQYGRDARAKYLEPRRAQFLALQATRRDPLMDHLAYERVLSSIDGAIVSNSQISTGIFQATLSELAKANNVCQLGEYDNTATADDCSTARACIRGLFRDWSLEGAAERAASHVPILNALREEFGSRRDKGAVRVLIPGYGLGRLVHSISEIGLSVEGIDVSYHTLLACLYMFGGGSHGVPQPLCPWALSFSNHISRQHQLRRVAVPDLYLDWPIRVGHQPSAASAEQHVVFRRGGFYETYGGSAQAGKFSALVTCYFVDTAPNFLEYINTAWDCLEAGAIWINIGPLLWNIEENGPAGNGEGDTDGQETWKARNERLDYTGATLELTAEEVLGLLRAKGFAIERATDNIGPSMYVGNDLSMLRYIYNMAFWVARKPARTAKL